MTEANIAIAAARAVDVLRRGGVVLYPTDTLYGLGADALSDEAVAKIFEIKGRSAGKPLHAIVSDLDMVRAFAHVEDPLPMLIGELPKGQVTYIVKKKPEIVSGIAKEIETFGFRIPDSEFCLAMINAFGGPVTATSANSAGETPERTVDAILDQLGDVPIDLVVDGGELPERQPSTVVDVSMGEPVILREGAVPAADVWYALKPER